MLNRTKWHPIFWTVSVLRGNCTSTHKWACFVGYLKIFNTFILFLFFIFFTLKQNCVKYLVGRTVLDLIWFCISINIQIGPIYKINYTKHINQGEKPGWPLKPRSLFSEGSFKGTNGRQKTYEIFHVYCIFYSGFMGQTNVIFGITKDGSVVLNTLASWNCFICRNLFQNGAKDISEYLTCETAFCKKAQNLV